MKKVYLILIIMIGCLVLTSCTVRKSGKVPTLPSPVDTATAVATVATTTIPVSTATAVATASASATKDECKKKTELRDCFDSNDCTTDSCATWGRNECKHKDKKDDTACTTTPVKPTTNTPPPATNDGVCMSGVCSTVTCADAYGAGYTACPTGVTAGEEKYGQCCKAGEKCCSKDTEADPICCSANTNPALGDVYKCQDLGGLAEIFGKRGNVCQAASCAAGTTLCPAGGGNNLAKCCKAGEVCSNQIVEIPYIGTDVGDVPTCVPVGGCVAATHYLCHTTPGVPAGSICCRHDSTTTPPTKIEECKSEKNVYWCSAIDGACPAGESFCGGARGTTGDLNICCPANSYCYYHPNGIYRCIDKTTGAIVAQSDPIGAIIAGLPVEVPTVTTTVASTVNPTPTN